MYWENIEYKLLTQPPIYSTLALYLDEKSLKALRSTSRKFFEITWSNLFLENYNKYRIIILRSSAGFHFPISASNDNPQEGSISIGPKSGHNDFGKFAVAIGDKAGFEKQGNFSISLGKNAGLKNQYPHSIVFNATGLALSPKSPGFFVAPIRKTHSNFQTQHDRVLVYDKYHKEIKYLKKPKEKKDTTYQGKDRISEDADCVGISLPSHVDHTINNFTVHITPIYDGKTKMPYSTSEVQENKFWVYGEPGPFFWLVKG